MMSIIFSLIFLVIAAAMRRLRPAVMIAIAQSLLYAMLFLILRMEDYALIAGTALLVAGTAALMVVTSGVNKPKGGAEPRR